MKRALILCILLLSTVAVRATVTINLGASVLYNSDGTTPEAAGMLVQLVASTTDNVFTAPNSGSFTGGSSDDIVLASFFINFSGGTVAQPLIITLTGNLGAGDQIMLRWFPTLSGTTPPSAPPAGAAFGQFRTDLVENFSSTGWVLPADGSTIDLNFLTVAGGGTEPESAGRAAFTVALIPEPTTYALLMVGLAGAAFMRRRKKIA
jgi:hypothetical protein